MTLIIFLIVLGVLVFVHELGHFLVAKRAGVHVEEFGFGYPPRALSLGRKWETLFTLNWIPFGGFVKIFGEDYEEARSLELKDKSLQTISSSKPQAISFTEVSKKWQAAILVAGVTFNLIFAWLLFSLGFIIGMPTPAENNFGVSVRDPVLMVVGVLPESPAQDVGLKTGDKIKNIFTQNGDDIGPLTPEVVSDFIGRYPGKFAMEIERGEETLNFYIVPEESAEIGRKIIGVSMDMVGTLSLPFHKALYQGGKVTLNAAYFTVLGLFNLVKDSIKGEADISQITGPVGIVGLVGDASRLGIAYLITFSSLISINLAIINLVPFPALDGGRLLFVALEGITKKRINPKFTRAVNTVGFALLITLMLIVTYRDILNLF